jgi:hypothetical protein
VRIVTLDNAKPLLLIATFAVCAIMEHLPFGSAILLSLIHLGGLAICGELVRIAAGAPICRSLCDRIVINYMLGWCLTPVSAFVACLSGSIGIGVAIAIVACGILAVLRLRARPEAPAAATESIPVSLYVVAVLFTIISVAVPFSSFSGSSILREFYGDAMQRFGVIYALSRDVPPHNPFFAGAPLRYYWLWMVPYAGEYRYICGDLFTVWKCGQTWTALCFPLALWYLLRHLLNSRRAAYMAVLFALVFTSYELFAHPLLLQKVAEMFGIHYDIQALATDAADPDFTIGVLQRYSDQLLTEDFWYIPQNTYAIIVVLTAMAALTAGRAGAGALILSALAGINTFFAPPAFAGFMVACMTLYGWRSGLTALCALVAGSSICIAMCGMIGLWEAAVTATVFAATGILAAARDKAGTEAAVSGRSLQFWTIAMLVSFACLIALSPLHNMAALVLGYSPSILFGIYYLIRLVVKGDDAGYPLIVFLLVFCTVFAFITVFISFQNVPTAPGWLRDAALRTGQEVNLFNFYHKSGKMVRVAWGVFGAMGLSVLLPYLQRIAGKRPYLITVASACLFLSALPPLFRPFTYLGHCPVSEADAAAYLVKAAGNGAVLIEDYRSSEINQLAPVKVFYYSQWSDGNMGLNTLSGSWADQYLPAGMRRLSRQRERQVNDFFASTDLRHRAAFLKSNHIGFILTRQPYDFSGIADPVVNKPGGYLYRVRR